MKHTHIYTPLRGGVSGVLSCKANGGPGKVQPPHKQTGAALQQREDRVAHTTTHLAHTTQHPVIATRSISSIGWSLPSP